MLKIGTRGKDLKMKDDKIIEIITGLNNKFYEATGEELPPFTFYTDGFSQVVLWYEEVLWNSEDDDREYDYDRDEFSESLEDYLVRTVCERAKDILRVFEG